MTEPQWTDPGRDTMATLADEFEVLQYETRLLLTDITICEDIREIIKNEYRIQRACLRLALKEARSGVFLH